MYAAFMLQEWLVPQGAQTTNAKWNILNKNRMAIWCQIIITYNRLSASSTGNWIILCQNYYSLLIVLLLPQIGLEKN